MDKDQVAAILSEIGILLELKGENPFKTRAYANAACKAGKGAVWDGFGEKTQPKILEGIYFRRSYAPRPLMGNALAVAEPMLEAFRIQPDVIRAGPAGSLRRFKEIVGDIDFLVS